MNCQKKSSAVVQQKFERTIVRKLRLRKEAILICSWPPRGAGHAHYLLNKYKIISGNPGDKSANWSSFKASKNFRKHFFGTRKSHKPEGYGSFGNREIESAYIWCAHYFRGCLNVLKSLSLLASLVTFIHMLKVPHKSESERGMHVLEQRYGPSFWIEGTNTLIDASTHMNCHLRIIRIYPMWTFPTSTWKKNATKSWPLIASLSGTLVADVCYSLSVHPTLFPKQED